MAWVLWRLNTPRIVPNPDFGDRWPVAVLLNSITTTTTRTTKKVELKKSKMEMLSGPSNLWAIPGQQSSELCHEMCWSDSTGCPALPCFLVWMYTQALHDGLLPLAFSPWKHTTKLHQIRRERHAGEIWGSSLSFSFAKYRSGLKCLRSKTVPVGISRQPYGGLGSNETKQKPLL